MRCNPPRNSCAFLTRNQLINSLLPIGQGDLPTEERWTKRESTQIRWRFPKRRRLPIRRSRAGYTMYSPRKVPLSSSLAARVRPNARAQRRAPFAGPLERVVRPRSFTRRSSSLMRVWYLRPWARKKARTSASRRIVVKTFFGAFCGPRPRRTNGGPNISSDQAGLSGSMAFVEVVLGDFKVIARFIFFCLA